MLRSLDDLAREALVILVSRRLYARKDLGGGFPSINNTLRDERREMVCGPLEPPPYSGG